MWQITHWLLRAFRNDTHFHFIIMAMPQEVLFYYISEGEEPEIIGDEQSWPFTDSSHVTKYLVLAHFKNKIIHLITKRDSPRIPSGQSIKLKIYTLYVTCRISILGTDVASCALEIYELRSYLFLPHFNIHWETEADKLQWTLLFRMKNRSWAADTGLQMTCWNSTRAGICKNSFIGDEYVVWLDTESPPWKESSYSLWPWFRFLKGHSSPIIFIHIPSRNWAHRSTEQNGEPRNKPKSLWSINIQWRWQKHKIK